MDRPVCLAQWSLPAGFLLVSLFAGCGGGEANGNVSANGAGATVADAGIAPPPLSIEPAPTAEEPEATRFENDAPRVLPVGGGPAKGSPEWYLQEISVLRTKPLPKGDQPNSVGAALEKRNTEIADLAMQVIVKTHEDPAREEVFDEGVRRLLEARLQLALGGDEAHGNELYRDCEQFQKRDPKSTAAAIAGHVRLRYAQANALRYGREEQEWIEEYARQARLFAGAYPNESGIGAAALAGAARSCELNDMPKEAGLCYAMLAKQFPETPQAGMAAGVLRRMNLVGQLLALKGPTIDGGFTSIEDHRGRVVLVVFWTSAAKPFRDQVTALTGLETKYGRYGLELIGVCLDGDEAAVDAFLGERKITWPQLFHSNPEQRGWQHPAAEYYGVRDVPTYLLVDHTGIVRHVGRDAEPLEPAIREELLRLREAIKPSK